MIADSDSCRQFGGLTPAAFRQVRCALAAPFRSALAGEVQAVRVVHEPVEDGVGDRRVGEHLVPVLHVDLAGDDRRAAPLPVVEDLQQIAALIRP